VQRRRWRNHNRRQQLSVGCGCSRRHGLTLPTAKSPRKRLEGAQQVEMRCELPRVDKSRQQASLPPIISVKLFLILNIAAIAWAPVAKAQVSNFEKAEGEISGTVLLEAGKRPASQVVISLKSRVAGIFRTVLTDLEGQFKVQRLPRGTYDIAVEEAGYEAFQATAQLDGPSSKLVMYLRSKSGAIRQSDYTVSVRELKIPGKARNELQKGFERLTKNDPAGSLSHFTKATQAFPGYFEAYYHMGMAEMKLGHNEEATRAFQMAIDLSGGRYAWAEFGFGYLLCQEGRPGEAEKIIRRGLEAEDAAPDGHVILGNALMQLNRPDEAEKSAQEALLRNPNFADAYLVLSNVAASKGDYRAELEDLDAYLKLRPIGPANERIRQVREAAVKILAKSHPQD
jgi:tetratricopeptide (TPR) repeat protein